MITCMLVDACAASRRSRFSSSGSSVPSTTEMLTMRNSEAETAAASTSDARDASDEAVWCAVGVVGRESARVCVDRRAS